MTPSGRAPVIDTLRVASATLSAAPSHGSSAPTAWLPSVVATSAFVVPLIRRTAAPWPGPGDRVRLDVAVVLLEDPAPARRGSAEPSRATGARRPGPSPAPGARRSARPAAPGAGAAPAARRRRRERAGGRSRRSSARPPGSGRARRAGAGRPSASSPPSTIVDVAVGGDPADDRDRQAPALADLADGRPSAPGCDDREHPLLRLARSSPRTAPCPGSRRGIASRSTRDPGPGPIGGLRGGAGDAAGAEVLEALDEAALDQLEGRLDEQLLGERVADLDGRPLRRVVVGEGRRGEDRRAADPVAAGRRAEQDDEVARARAPPPASAAAPRAGRWP